MAWVRRLVWVVAFALGAGVAGCGACGDPNALAVDGEPPDVAFHWEDSNAMGFYVTHPDAWIPDGPGKMVEGEVYWVLEATSFPGGFKSPVVYGEIPGGAKDSTFAHGGPEAPGDLACGVLYKVTVVALRGTDETFVEWDCPPGE